VSIRWKVILPYLLLTLVVAVTGVYVVTRLVASSLTERLTNQLLQAGRVVSDGMARQELNHVAAARLVAYTRGVGEALRDGDRSQLAALAKPAAAGLGTDSLTLVDADAEAYGAVNSAMALPKDSDDTKRRRKEALQIALGEASEVPLKGMQMAIRGLKSLADLTPKCNKHLTSDLSAAATFLESALTGCGENVRINAVSLTDKVRRARLEQEHAGLLGEGRVLREQIRSGVELRYAAK